MKGRRISYVDGLKGIVMILMIYGHVALFVFHNESSQFNTVVDYTRMPFFFFVSGLFAAKTYLGARATWGKVRRRIADQLMPSILVGLVYCFCSHTDLTTALFSLHKGGYWFVWVLVQIFVLFMLLSLLLDGLRCSIYVRSLLFLLLAMGTLALPSILSRCEAANGPLAQVLSLYFVVKYLTFFLMGVIAGYYRKYFTFLISNPVSTGGIFLCYALSVALSTYLWSVPFAALFSLTGVLLLFVVGHHYSGFFGSPSRAARWLTQVGKCSLEVYLLQYFVFLGLDDIPFPEGFLDAVNRNFMLELCVYLSLSLLVTFCSMCLLRLLDCFPLVCRMVGPSRQEG